MSNYKNDALLGGYGLGLSIWQGSSYAAIISLSTGYYMLAAKNYGAR
jgi:hypothetical protein